MGGGQGLRCVILHFVSRITDRSCCDCALILVVLLLRGGRPHSVTLLDSPCCLTALPSCHTKAESAHNKGSAHRFNSYSISAPPLCHSTAPPSVTCDRPLTSRRSFEVLAAGRQRTNLHHPGPRPYPSPGAPSSDQERAPCCRSAAAFYH